MEDEMAALETACCFYVCVGGQVQERSFHVYLSW